VEERAHVDEVGPRIGRLEAICAEEGRDPASIGRSVSVSVRPLSPAGDRPDVLSGSPQEISDAFRSFESAGYTRLEVMFDPGTKAALEGLVRVLEAFDGR